MLHALRPAHVGDMNEPVDTWLYFYEGTETREVAHFAIDACSHWILQWEHHPRILLGLFHTERDLLLVRIDFENDRFDRLADGHELRRMTDVARPAHLRDMNQPFNTGLQFNKGAVVRDRDNLTSNARSNRILLGNILPRVALEL